MSTNWGLNRPIPTVYPGRGRWGLTRIGAWICEPLLTCYHKLCRDLEEPPYVKKPRLSAEKGNSGTVTDETKYILMKHIFDSDQQHLNCPP